MADDPLMSADESSKQVFAQEEIDRLLAQNGKSAPAAPTKAAAAEVADMSPPEEGAVPAADLEYLLNQAEQARASIDSPAGRRPPPGAVPYQLESFTGAPPSTENATLELIRDVELELKIELGRTHMYLEDVLRLRKGSVVPLDKLAGDPVDLYVNGRLIARGEVLVLNDNFCVRVAELIAGTSPSG